MGEVIFDSSPEFTGDNSKRKDSFVGNTETSDLDTTSITDVSFPLLEDKFKKSDSALSQFK